MSGANYNGTQASNTSYVKNFVQGSFPDTWKYVTINGVKYLTTASSTNSLYLYNDLTVLGTIYGTVSSPSDENLKNHIEDVTQDDLSALMQLAPKTFSFNSDPSNRLHYGFIAQQVEQVAPCLVSTVDGVKSINYTEIVPMLLAKIQDLQTQLDSIILMMKST